MVAARLALVKSTPRICGACAATINDAAGRRCRRLRGVLTPSPVPDAHVPPSSGRWAHGPQANCPAFVFCSAPARDWMRPSNPSRVALSASTPVGGATAAAGLAGREGTNGHSSIGQWGGRIFRWLVGAHEWRRAAKARQAWKAGARMSGGWGELGGWAAPSDEQRLWVASRRRSSRSGSWASGGARRLLGPVPPKA